MSPKARWGWPAGITLALLVADQAAKAWAWQLAGPLRAGFVAIRPQTNAGGVFGLFPGGGGTFTVLTGLACVGILYALARLRPGEKLTRGGLALALGGALGNLVDRLACGAVRDFIDVGFWPTFNLADAGITVGAVLLVLALWRRQQVAEA